MRAFVDVTVPILLLISPQHVIIAQQLHLGWSLGVEIVDKGHGVPLLPPVDLKAVGTIQHKQTSLMIAAQQNAARELKRSRSNQTFFIHRHDHHHHHHYHDEHHHHHHHHHHRYDEQTCSDGSASRFDVGRPTASMVAVREGRLKVLAGVGRVEVDLVVAGRRWERREVIAGGVDGGMTKAHVDATESIAMAIDTPLQLTE